MASGAWEPRQVSCQAGQQVDEPKDGPLTAPICGAQDPERVCERGLAWSSRCSVAGRR